MGVKKEKGLIQLTSFCLYRVKGKEIDVVAGAEAARFSDDGKVQLLASHVPFHSDLFAKRTPAPFTGLLALYGHRDALDEERYWRERARAVKAEFAYVTYDVNVGEISTQLLDRATLKANKSIGFMNLRRTQSSLQQEFLAQIRDYVTQEGGDPDKSMERVAQIATRPDLFVRLLEDDPDMANIDVLVTLIADSPDSPSPMRQVGFIRAGAEIRNLVQGSDHYEMVLPSWMTDKSELAKYKRQAVAAA